MTIILEITLTDTPPRDQNYQALLLLLYQTLQGSLDMVHVQNEQHSLFQCCTTKVSATKHMNTKLMYLEHIIFHC